MNILYLVPDLFGAPGGIARYCRLVARVLCESARVRLDALALWDPPNIAIDSRYLFGDKFTYTSCGGNRRAFTFRVSKAIALRRYDLVLYGHVGFAPLRFAPLPPFTRRRHIVFIYGTDAWDRLPQHKRWALRVSDRVVAISQYTATRATRANSLDEKRIRVLHNCLDPTFEPGGNEIVSPAARLAPIWPGRTMITVSRLLKAESGKGHDTVLRALRTVLKHVPDLHYLVIGDGDLRPELEHLALELGVAHRTHFLGGLSDSEIGQLMDASELYVMPSKTEGFGFVFLEAMAHGLPILAGNRDASSEVLGDSTGMLVDPDSESQVAAAIVRLLSDTALRGRLALGGRERLDAMFRYPHFKDTLLSHLCEVLEGGSHSRVIEQRA